MNAIFFGVKRAHLRSVAVGRKILEESTLTPARYDLLRVLRHTGEEWPGLRQAHVVRALGLARSTVSEMLVRLEAQGLVCRRQGIRNRRARYVSLTPLGRALLRRASRRPSRRAWRRVEDALSVRRRDRWMACENLENGLGRLRRAFADRATFHYPWHPDD